MGGGGEAALSWHICTIEPTPVSSSCLLSHCFPSPLACHISFMSRSVLCAVAATVTGSSQDYYYNQNSDVNYLFVFAYTKPEFWSKSQSHHCNLLIVPTGPSGYQNHYPDGRPGAYEDTHRNYDVYTAGLSEEQQLERALRASLWDRGKSLAPFNDFKTSLVARRSEKGLFGAN